MIVTRTPLRFSLAGGGSDLPEYWMNYGECKIISMTLDVSMYVTYSVREKYICGQCGYTDADPLRNVYDSRIRVSYTNTELVERPGDLKHDLVRETLGWLAADAYGPEIVRPAFEITTVCDIPSRGSGLGSSAALVVGLLKAVLPPNAGQADPDSLIHFAVNIERDLLGRDIGYQDQMAAAYGGIRRYMITWDGRISRILVSPLRDDNAEDIGYDLASHLIAFRLPSDRSESIASAGEHSLLADMKKDMEWRSGYIGATVALVSNMYSALCNHDYAEVGKLMKLMWDLKKASHGLVDKDIERWYDIGMNNGALAGKVSGSMSAGAGHLFFLCYPDDQDNIRKALGSELVEMHVGYYPHGSRRWEI